VPDTPQSTRGAQQSDDVTRDAVTHHRDSKHDRARQRQVASQARDLRAPRLGEHDVDGHVRRAVRRRAAAALRARAPAQRRARAQRERLAKPAAVRRRRRRRRGRPRGAAVEREGEFGNVEAVEPSQRAQRLHVLFGHARVRRQLAALEAADDERVLARAVRGVVEAEDAAGVVGGERDVLLERAQAFPRERRADQPARRGRERVAAQERRGLRARRREPRQAARSVGELAQRAGVQRACVHATPAEHDVEHARACGASRQGCGLLRLAKGCAAGVRWRPADSEAPRPSRF
jgi:hypothetical protein